MDWRLELIDGNGGRDAWSFLAGGGCHFALCDKLTKHKKRKRYREREWSIWLEYIEVKRRPSLGVFLSGVVFVLFVVGFWCSFRSRFHISFQYSFSRSAILVGGGFLTEKTHHSRAKHPRAHTVQPISSSSRTISV